jgi:ligand-binding sensor domain-containing protein/signal transduction histidine kinase/DNA-binding response OmpR family regulator
MREMKPLLIAALYLGLFASIARSNVAPPVFKHILKDHGLASNKVLCITQDKNGFMWFGTEDGLSRFDGSKYINFRKNPGNKTSLVTNYVNTIYEAPATGHLWIGTAEGLCRLDTRTYKFYPGLPNGALTLQKLNIASIHIDKRKTMWIGTNEGLFRLDQGARAPILCLKSTTPKITSNVNCIYSDYKGNLWVGTNFGLFRLNRKSKQLEPYFLQKSPARIMSIAEDSQKHLWISSYSGAFEITPTATHRYCMENGQLKNDKVQGVVEDDKGNIYLAVRDGLGLHYLDRATRKVVVFKNDVFNQTGINSGALTSIYKDKFKNIWIGTWAKGLNFIDKNQKQFAHYNVNHRPDGLLSNYIRAVFQDSEGDIWIGTKDEGGLSKFNPTKGTFTHYKEWLYNSKSSAYSFIFSIAELRPGQLLVGTHDRGLQVWNKKTGAYKQYQNNPANKRSIADNSVIAMIKDQTNKVWVATARALQTFDVETDQFNMILDSAYVKCFFDTPSELYIGSGTGLYSYNRSSGKVKRYHKKAKLNSVEVPNITGIVQDSKGFLWLSTVGKGLLQFDPKTRKFTSYTIKNGLPSDLTCGIQIDERGNIWISTSNGLSRFNPRSKKFRNYYYAEGLQGNEFEKYASFKTKDGHLIFGGSNGFNYFYPDDIKDNPIVPKVIITDFKIFNKPVEIGTGDSPLKEIISNTKELELNYKQSVFTLEFSALNFSSPLYNQYAYKLEPLEKEWNYIGVHNLVNYSSLPAGTYTFKVKASNNDGVWNNLPTTLAIRVLPAPWKSGWAYFFYCMIAGTLILLGIRYKNFETRLKIAQIEKEKLEELNTVKTQFFTNISHEFKTPLTMILSPLNKLINSAEKDEEKKQLNYISRNALRLQNLINQLMELRSIESNSLSPEYQKGNIGQYLSELVTVFQPVADDHQIRLTFATEGEIQTYFDPDKTEKIFYNILSNAMKFTPDGGSVNVSVRTVNQHPSATSPFDGSYIEAKIGNTGSTISPEHIPHLFENYYHIDRPNSLSQPGTGIGLAFTKELVDLLGGTIHVESSEELTLFTVCLPDIKVSQAELNSQLKSTNAPFSYSKQLIEVLKFEKVRLEPKSTNNKAPSILLVEDNKELRELLFNTLSVDYKVSLAKNGEEGLELIKKVNPELVISDIIMPVRNGIELCREIKTNIQYNHIPVVLLTASNTQARKISGMSNGADVYIEKPFDLEYLKLQIRNIIQTRKAQREAFAKKITAEPEKVVVDSPDEQFVVNAIHIVERNLNNADFDVDKFASEMNLTRTTLYRKIKALTDLSASEFVTNIRLKKAANMLSNSQLTVSEIAYQTGFSSLSYFGMCFKKNYHLSPTAFAEKYRNNNSI